MALHLGKSFATLSMGMGKASCPIPIHWRVSMTNVSTQISDVIVPAIFTPYTQQLTMEKTALIQSGVAQRDDFIDNLLAGGGLTFTVPSWQDIGDPAENVSSDNANTDSTPNTTQTSGEGA